jgi:hypothetical protein
MSQSKGSDVIPIMHITQSILVVRDQSVMLDADLAELYGVSTKRFNQQVRRNRERFPADFMFQLTEEEISALRSHIATSNDDPERRGGRRYLPYAFTEHGAIMAATILNSSRAAQVSVFVVRAFVKLREVLFSHKELGKKLEELERKLDTHDQVIVGILNAIRAHMHSTETQRRPIGFTADLDGV